MIFFIDDNETNESVDNRFIRQENKEYSIVNEMLKKGFSCLSKNKKGIMGRLNEKVS